MLYGVIDGDVIANVVEANDAEIAAEVTGAEVVEGAAIGWVRIGDDWGPVEPEPEVPVKRPLSSLEFEFHVQQSAQLSNDDVLEMMDDPALRLFWMRLNKAVEIQPDHPFVAQGLAALVALGHLTEEQAAAITDDWPVA